MNMKNKFSSMLAASLVCSMSFAYQQDDPLIVALQKILIGSAIFLMLLVMVRVL